MNVCLYSCIISIVSYIIYCFIIIIRSIRFCFVCTIFTIHMLVFLASILQVDLINEYVYMTRVLIL